MTARSDSTNFCVRKMDRQFKPKLAQKGLVRLVKPDKAALALQKGDAGFEGVAPKTERQRLLDKRRTLIGKLKEIERQIKAAS